MTDQDHSDLDDVAAAAEAAGPAVKRKFLRVTSTMYLDWPQLGFELHALESGKVNEFATPEDLPEAVVDKLKGFFRSGHVKVYVITEFENGTISRDDQTPTAEELADGGEEEPASEPAPSLPPASVDAIPSEGESPEPPAAPSDDPAPTT
jgi:hypothetical protein